MKSCKKLIKYMLCVLLIGIMLLPALSLTAYAAQIEYELGFVDENGQRLYGTINIDRGEYYLPQTFTTTQYTPTIKFNAESGQYYHITFQNEDGYYSFYTLRASEKDLIEKPKHSVTARLTRVPYTVTVRYQDGTVASGVQVRDNNLGTNTTTDSNGQCTVYGTSSQTTEVQVFDGVSWVTKGIYPNSPGPKTVDITIHKRQTVPVKVMMDGTDVTSISQASATGDGETVKSANGSLLLKEGITYQISAGQYEPGAIIMGFQNYYTGGFSSGETSYTVQKNPSVVTLTCSLNKPVASYYDYSIQYEPFRFTDGGTQTLNYGQRVLLDIENRIAGATYTFESADPNVLSVNGSVLEAKASGETTLKVKVEYLNSSATSVTTVRIPKNQIVVPYPSDIFAEYTYNGQELTLHYNENAAYTVTGNKQTNAGTYPVKISLVDKKNTEWKPGNFLGVSGSEDIIAYSFVIKKANLTAADLNFTLPDNCVYDGNKKEVTVALKSGKSGAGEITVKYYDENNNQLDGAPVNAGNYSIKVSATEGANFLAATDLTDSSWEFSVKRAEGTASVSADDFVYGEDAVVTPKSDTNGTDAVKYWFKAKDAGDDTYTENIPVNAGKYTVKAVFPKTRNYEEVITTDDFEILRRQITLKAADDSKIYGDADPDELNWVITNGSLVGSDIPNVTLSREVGENVGDYVIKACESAGANPNYDITFTDGIFTIKKAKLTVTAEDKAAVYGDAIPAYTAVFTGFRREDTAELFADTLAFLCDYTAVSNKGEYSITPYGCESENYIAEYVPGKLTVSEKPITEADVALDGVLTYNGTEQTQKVTVKDGITYGVTGDKAVNSGTYTLTVTGTGNYTGQIQRQWSIGKAPLTITVENRVIYIGEKLPVVGYMVSGLKEADELTTAPDIRIDTDGKTAGTYAIKAKDADAGENYSITYIDGALIILDKESQVETDIKMTPLTVVPDGLLNTKFNTVEAIREELLSRIVMAHKGYTDEYAVHYDVTLQFSLDGGETWITATAENFPTEGITIVLPYPEGTNAKEYEFIVSHMFTVTSERLGIKAGDVELPEVEELKNGLRVTLKGLSPVIVAARYHDHEGGTATCKDLAVCTVCDNSYGVLDGENHAGGTEVKDAKKATCAKNGYTGDTCCKGCGEVLEKGKAIDATGEHTYGEWKTVKEATTTAKGEKQRSCSVCGYTLSEEIPQLTVTPDESKDSATPSKPATPNTPATGDMSNIVLHSAVFAVSLAAIVALFMICKKRKQEKA